MTQTPATTAPAVGVPTDAVRRRLAAVVGSHLAVDVYSAFVPPLLGLLEVRCQLTTTQAAWLLGIGSLSSGLSQPLAAWLSDRTDSRIFGALGLGLAAVCLSAIGSASSFGTLLPIYLLGMIGVGIFHPIGASVMGQLADQGGRGRRSVALSVFFVAGMIGGATGSVLATRTASAPGGFDLLRWFMIPGLLLVFVLHAAVRRVPHRHEAHREIHFDPLEIRRRWIVVGLLYVGNAMRFTVNIALLFLFVRLAHAYGAARHPEWSDAAIAEDTAPLVGNLNAMAIVGMAIGGLVAGTVVRAGREKPALVLLPIVCAPFVAVLPLAGASVACLLAVVAGIGYAATIPVTMSLSQRMLPHRTSLASGLMLGGAWSVAVVGPVLASWCLQTAGLSLPQTFGLAAGLLAASGLVAIPIRSSLLRPGAGLEASSGRTQ